MIGGLSEQAQMPGVRKALLGLGLVVYVKKHSREQHQPLDDLLQINADAKDRHAVVHNPHDKSTDHRTYNLAHTA